MSWREDGYIWGNARAVVGADAPVDLVNLPRFDRPMPLRVDLTAPLLTVVRFTALVGRGDGSADEVALSFNAATRLGSHKLYGSSLRVTAHYVSGVVTSGNNVAAAFATLCEDGGISASFPKTFASTPVVASQPQAIVAAAMVGAGARRRLTIANYQGAGTANLLLASSRVATALDFDIIVPPNTTFLDEAGQTSWSGIWDAAGAGFARIATWAE